MGQLDEQTKARIRAEEEYRAQARAEAEHKAVSTPPPQKPTEEKLGCLGTAGVILVAVVALFLIVGLIVQIMPIDEETTIGTQQQSATVEVEETPAYLLAKISRKPDKEGEISRNLSRLAKSCGEDEMTMADQIAMSTKLVNEVHPNVTADVMLEKALEVSPEWGHEACSEMLAMLTEIIRNTR